VRNYVEAKPFEMQRNLFRYLAEPERKLAKITPTKMSKSRQQQTRRMKMAAERMGDVHDAADNRFCTLTFDQRETRKRVTTGRSQSPFVVIADNWNANLINRISS
jgi:hypothetical protein